MSVFNSSICESVLSVLGQFKNGLLNKLPRKLTHKMMSFKKSDLKRGQRGRKNMEIATGTLGQNFCFLIFVKWIFEVGLDLRK